MHYVISDIHGCYEEFMELLRKIQFSERDTLYVIGDVIDRGPEPLKVLQFMMLHYNIIPIIGNHEYIAMKVLPSLLQEVNADNVEELLTSEFLQGCQLWFEDGGKITANQIRNLPVDEQTEIIDYIGEFSFYEELDLNGKHYLMIHSLPKDYEKSPDRNFVLEEVIFARPNYHGNWNGKTTYIIGHTPTFKIGEEYRGKIFRNQQLIDIDCGCVAGNFLGALCLETGEEYYVKKHDYE